MDDQISDVMYEPMDVGMDDAMGDDMEGPVDTVASTHGANHTTPHGMQRCI